MDEIEAYERGAALLRSRGIEDRIMGLVLMVMVVEKLSYWKALGFFREWMAEKGLDCAIGIWHSDFCYRCLKAGLDEGPGAVLEEMAQEVSA